MPHGYSAFSAVILSCSSNFRSPREVFGTPLQVDQDCLCPMLMGGHRKDVRAFTSDPVAKGCQELKTMTVVESEAIETTLETRTALGLGE
ncbi:hypothetical protein AVEN_187159-1 [Araneus ventricosus]|uniref:Uncharacterized protein n=1 Tax=Araneus ventricosus TaxID=182803 RepID=A0A4Y2TX08_ARAVE|nr:hypothetical protein AVEN_187159-1 [Araneus ventricosus]